MRAWRVSPFAVALLATALAPAVSGVCPNDVSQCMKGGMAQQTTFHVNPLGVATLDIPNATVNANRTLEAGPGALGNVTVELLHPLDEENGTANVTITVASAAVNWTSNLTRTVVNLTGFHNETFNFTVAGSPGAAVVFVNVSSGGVVAPMEFGFLVTSGAPSPIEVTPGVPVVVAAALALALAVVLALLIVCWRLHRRS